MSSNENISEIILRYLNGEATEAENQYLRQWIGESEANKSEFALITKLWNDSNEAAIRPFDSEAALQKVMARITGEKARVIKMFPWKRSVAIAASLILIAGAFYFYTTTSKEKWTETVAQTSNKTLLLPDSSVITLRKGSKLFLSNHYQDSREIRLEGEAFFQIKHNTANPLSIVTPQSIIQDIGTAFLVRSMDSVDQVMVTEGEVSFKGKGSDHKEIKLQTGEAAFLKEGQLEKQMVEHNNLLSWKTNALKFVNTPLEQVAADLENYYAIKVLFSKELNSFPVSAQFDNDTLEQAVKELRLLTGLRFQLHDSVLEISK